MTISLQMGKECTHATECTPFFTDIADMNYPSACLSLPYPGNIGENKPYQQELPKKQGQKVTVKSEDTHLHLLGFHSILGFTGRQGTRVLGRALEPGRFRTLQFQFSYCINKSVP